MTEPGDDHYHQVRHPTEILFSVDSEDGPIWVRLTTFSPSTRPLRIVDLQAAADELIGIIENRGILSTSIVDA